MISDNYLSLKPEIAVKNPENSNKPNDQEKTFGSLRQDYLLAVFAAQFAGEGALPSDCEGFEQLLRQRAEPPDAPLHCLQHGERHRQRLRRILKQILLQQVTKDSRIRVLNKANGGLGSARNHGIEHATGDYLLFLDADNLATLCWFHHHVVIHGEGFSIDPNSPPQRRRFIRPRVHDPP